MGCVPELSMAAILNGTAAIIAGLSVHLIGCHTSTATAGWCLLLLVTTCVVADLVAQHIGLLLKLVHHLLQAICLLLSFSLLLPQVSCVCCLALRSNAVAAWQQEVVEVF